MPVNFGETISKFPTVFTSICPILWYTVSESRNNNGDNDMNEQNEIGGDLQDEYTAIQEAELLEESPIMDLTDQDLEGWYQEWLSEQDDPASIDPDFYDPRVDFGPDPRD